MKHTPIRSSNLESTAHDPATQKMQVKFKNGGTYEWDGVSAEEHAALRAAGSPGAHLRYNFQKGSKVS